MTTIISKMLLLAKTNYFPVGNRKYIKNGYARQEKLKEKQKE